MFRVVHDQINHFEHIAHSQTLTLESTTPKRLKHGGVLSEHQLVVETYGQLNTEKTNAILICHALNASHHVAGTYPNTHAHPHKQGWWDNMIGGAITNKPIDVDVFFVIGVNNLGSCFGSTGPSCIDPASQQAYGLNFPTVTVEDWVQSQYEVMKHFGIKQFAAVVGGSMGGMQAFTWSVLHPNCLHNCITIASTPKLSAQNIAFNEVARQAILGDFAEPNLNLNLNSNSNASMPTSMSTSTPAPHLDGLKLARMIGHITYLSDEDMAKKFGRQKKHPAVHDGAVIYTTSHFSADAEFEVESYLRYQADKFVHYFDPYSYLLATKALDYFDASLTYPDLESACAESVAKHLLISFTTDWRFPPARSREWLQALIKANKSVSYLEIDAPHGHDAFLMQNQHYFAAMRSYFRGIAKQCL